jgi:hypothetical protein
MNGTTKWLIGTALLAGCVDDETTELGTDMAEALVEQNCGMKSNEAGGYDSGVLLDSFWSGSSGFTLSTTVMPEFVYADDQPIFGNHNGAFWVGAGDFRARARNVLDCDGDYVPVLTLHKGSTEVHYLAPTWQRGTWHHLAMTWSPGRVSGTALVQLYLDGVGLRPYEKVSTARPGEAETCANVSDGVGGTVVVTSGSPVGTLRIGQGGDRFFYGLLDTVTVHNDALTAPEVAALAGGGGPASGTVVWSTGFGTMLGSCSGTLGTGTARKVTIGVPTPSDANLFTLPSLVAPTATTYHLPWGHGQIWRVIQGVDSPGSHNGYAAFSWDFGKVGGSGGAIVRAAADGQLVHVIEDIDKPDDVLDENKLWIETPSGEVTTHLHLEPFSVSEMFFGNNPPASLPEDGANPVAAASEHLIARVGYSTKEHLHFSVRRAYAFSFTMPIAFSNYEVAIDCATNDEITAATPGIASHSCWKAVTRGVPRGGTYLRRL